ncbi:MAG: hypothetical protein COU11_02240 [Candidatus Harrisonbacteria bacterium CG10_big_fil_rev_8_21_14_0_10_49_15]|uniref:CARDB domain-containing protein n=1 Tax=Candidatus Harrisonbacteria bacterium CG10_big_fil_rev_8_21_14_0_10_49_15 TaxID=1974587 RepID=A0A2H0UKU5_9BACT|nr:MAG: hypothetical protein COU11_02240 [Candidatus Harrisonbacteria bacterium CG10_big_fil_rev_8_21_14_0_10_49_15]
MEKKETRNSNIETGIAARAAILILFSSFYFLVSAPLAHAQEYGFLERNIWFSQELLFAGETVRIYTVVFNGSEEDVTGTVEFYDQAEKLGEAKFSLAKGEQLRDVWIDWLAKEGEHAITARINGASSAILTKVVDGDRDGDKIGDREDLDNDNDGISDAQEKKDGTDPFKADTDGDGLNDLEDPAPLVFNLKEEKQEQVQKEEKPTLKDTAEVATANVLGVMEGFRERYEQGLEDKKQELRGELDAYKEEDALARQEQSNSRNTSGQRLNEAAGEEFVRLTDSEDGLPKLSGARIVKFLYYGVVSVGLFIFEHKPVFYAVLGLIFLKFIFIIIGKFRKKRYG